MKSSTMIDTVRSNTRNHELKLRALESKLSSENEQELRIKHSLRRAYSDFASIQIDGNADAYQSIQHVLDQRSAFEKRLRDELQTQEAQITAQLDYARTISTNIERTVHDANVGLYALQPYQDLQQATANAKALADASRGNYQEIEHECAAKLKAFDSDRLFQYLRKVHYGTVEYHRGHLVRQLDRWIAGLCNFNQNFASEQTLLAMRKANTDSFAVLQQAWEQNVDLLQEMFDKAHSAAGVPALEEKLAASELKAKEAKKRASTIQDQLVTYADKQDPYFLKANETLSREFESKSLQDLEAMAKQTPDKADDLQVQKITKLRSDLAATHERMKQIAAQKATAQSDYDRAKRLERDIDSSRYTSSSYRYSDSLNLDSLILGYMAGKLSNHHVVSHLDSSRQSVPTQTSSSSFSTSSSWGSSGGGFSTSSSGTSGSFSTSRSL